MSISRSAAGTTADVVHLSTGVGWAVAGSLIASATGLNPVVAGLGAGAAALAGAYTVLPALGLYDPVWKYEGKTIWKDATAHATYGAVTGITLGVVGVVGAVVRHRQAVAGATAIVADRLRRRG